jgi:hypothetical protein
MERVSFAAHQYRALKERITMLDPEIDEATLADTLEGLTDIREILSTLVRFALDDEAMATALRSRVLELEGRLERLESRAEKRRHLARDTMLELDIKKIVSSDMTISLRLGTSSLVIVDELLIPPRFWEPQQPRLNRKGLWSELRRGDQIPGASLSNPQPVLSVRTK